ncbi:hypothetical protein BVRB_3g051370 [Beta vulgaris subsp. vulgaris]|nr:hypothetical protein BVRB_3g051370 [Beta vulgaris subsp. vulgaris]
MAEAILAEVVSVIANKLSSQIYTGIMSVREQNTHIKRLQELKTVVEATLLDADSMESCSNVQRDVLEKLSCALAELDDFLDEEAARAKKKQTMNGNKFIKSVRLFFSESNQFFTPLKDAQKLKTIIEKFECIAKHHAQFGSIVSTSGGTNANDDIKDEFHTPLFPSLQRLVLRAMPKLKGWHRISDYEKHPRQAVQNNNLLQPKHAFPKMKHMRIDKIDWLTSMIREFRGMSSLSYPYIIIDEDLTIIPLCSANFPNGYQIFRRR